MKEHMKRVHESETLKCEQCSKEFKGKYNLNDHISRLHTKRERPTCDICGMKISDKSELKKHIKEVHENNRPYKCTYCPKAFNRKCHMRDHVERMHEKVINIKECELCGHVATNYHGLLIHITRMHHKKSTEVILC